MLFVLSLVCSPDRPCSLQLAVWLVFLVDMREAETRTGEEVEAEEGGQGNEGRNASDTYRESCAPRVYSRVSSAQLAGAYGCAQPLCVCATSLCAPCRRNQTEEQHVLPLSSPLAKQPLLPPVRLVHLPSLYSRHTHSPSSDYSCVLSLDS